MDGPYDVQLILPAIADSARLARLVAAGLAADADWTLDETDDLRVAVSELVALLAEPGDGLGHQVTLDYRRDGDSIQVTGTRTSGSSAESAPEAPSTPAPDDLALEILRVVVDEHDFTTNAAGRRFRLLKRAQKRS